MSSHETLTSGNAARRGRRDEHRLELVADLWDQVRAGIHQDRYQLLSKKVRLQRALIAAQERRSELIRRREEAAKLKKQDIERKRRQESEVAIQDKGRQALVHGKTKHLQNLADGLCEEKPALKVGATAKSSATIGHVSSERHGPALLTSSMVEEKTATDDTEPKNNVTGRESQLGKLYGHPAGSFSLQTQRRTRPDLSCQSGSLNASQIWAMLWSNSKEDLLQTDQKFSQDLKETFSAHVREGITKFRKPVHRSFTLAQDVPDLDRLMDRSRQHQTRVLQHKRQLNLRSSLANQNRARVLLHNNPLPFVDEEDQGISRFLSPLEHMSSVSPKPPPYMKWIREPSQLSKADSARGGNDENVPPPGEESVKQQLSVHSLVCTNGGLSLQDLWMSTHKPKGQPRYHFLTEKEAETKGDFRSKFKNLLPQKYGDHLNSVTGASMDNHIRQKGTAQSQGPGTQTHLVSPWQPLSLGALSEYKQQLNGDGRGEFLQGRPRVWHRLTASQT